MWSVPAGSEVYSLKWQGKHYAAAVVYIVVYIVYLE